MRGNPLLQAIKTVHPEVLEQKSFTPSPEEYFEEVDGVKVQAFSLLAKTKQARFAINKPIAKITPADILEHARRAAKYITRKDYDKFRKSLEGVKTSYNYENTELGFMLYLHTIMVEIGYAHLLVLAYDITHPNIDQMILLQDYSKLSGQLLGICSQYAKILYPSGGEYGKTLQGVMINELTRMGRRTGVNEPQKRDALFYTGENVSLAFMNSSKYGGVAMTTPMQKVLSMYHEELCKKLPADLTELGKVTLDELGKYSKIRITLDKYMELTKTKDKKTARKAIETASDRLFEISFITTVKRGKETVRYEGRLFQSRMTKQRGGIYEMEFSNNFLRYCSTTTPAVFHPAMYQIDGNKFRYGWSIIQKLRMYYEINRGREQAARLSVAKLLEAVPDIPTYEEVMSSTRDVTRRIIDPIEKTLDEWQRLSVLKSWEYSNAKGRPLTREQTESMDYDTWSSLYITFELNLPPQDQYIEQHQKRIAKAKERAAKKKAVSKKGGVVHS